MVSRRGAIAAGCTRVRGSALGRPDVARPDANSSGANFAARSSGSAMSISGAISCAYSLGSRPIRRSVFSRSARCRSRGSSAPKRWRPHSAIGCKRRILQELRRRQFDQGVWRLAKRRAKLLHETRLADAGFADKECELARAILATARPEFRPPWSLRSHHSVISLSPSIAPMSRIWSASSLLAVR
jgi:hypothetical protein